MKYPARCNYRACQARRTLTKRIEEYARPPRCHIGGCSGKMYIDWYRYRNSDADRGEACKLDCLPYTHRINNKECRGHADYVDARNNAPRPKHSPIPIDEWVPF